MMIPGQRETPTLIDVKRNRRYSIKVALPPIRWLNPNQQLQRI
jgi:hypothetical protein